MAFEVKMIAHSITNGGEEVITMQLKYPRFIHAEFMTHREFSRNASSSRAIPVKKMIEMVENDPAMPIHWGANQPGMQADNELDPELAAEVQDLWVIAAERAAQTACEMERLGAHKQVVNRILEPFQWISVVMTTSSLTNFFGLRSHKDAQPEIKLLSDMMKECYENSTPVLMEVGEWHLPYITDEDRVEAYRHCKIGRITRDEPKAEELNELLVKISTARCARVSYLTHEGKVPDIKADLELFERLLGAQPLHASPAEHQATPDMQDWHDGWVNPYHHGNLTGWRQHRKMLAGEYITTK